MRYGVDSVYYKLSQQCYSYNKDKYSYSVCPFKHVTQSVGGLGHHEIYIGRDASWIGTHILEMGHGDTIGCPAGAHRGTVVSNIFVKN